MTYGRRTPLKSPHFLPVFGTQYKQYIYAMKAVKGILSYLKLLTWIELVVH